MSLTGVAALSASLDYGTSRFRHRRGWVRSVLAACLCVAALASPPREAYGQEGIGAGDAFVTRYSGTRTEAGSTVIDTAGIVGSLVRLQAMGGTPNGSVVTAMRGDISVTAGDVGQVFGVAIDDNQPPNIYLTATSAFGLGRTDAGWMAGQWGSGGEPGSVWVLESANGYRPRLLAQVRLNGRSNSGAALGNIAYDRWHKQVLVSDLETGMIHRIRVGDGNDLGHYDHGSEGRGSFVDGPSGAAQSLPAITFDASSSARVSDCPSGTFANHVSCWNFADFRRRPYGLGVHRDAATQDVRLYYAIWGSDGFGAADWFAGGDERRNSVWSIRLTDSGDFDRASVRREFALPDMFTDPVAVAAKGFSRPVSDIAFPSCGGGDVMLLAERGGVRNLGAAAAEPFAYAQESRVLRYRRSASGVWQNDGRIDVGFSDRKAKGQPYLRANAAGGVSFGPGYDSQGRVNTGRRDGVIWSTGDKLCSADGPCVAAATATETDEGPVHGLQGSPAGARDEVMPAAAREPYPASGYATPPQTPRRSFIAGLDGDMAIADATMVGDIEVVQPCADARAETTPGTVPDGGSRHGIDLEIEKTGSERCMRGAACNFTITITNRGPDTYAGSVSFSEDLLEELLAPTFAPEPPWSCHGGDGWAICRHEPVTLEPGQSVSATLTGTIDPATTATELSNCAVIQWPLASENSDMQNNFLAEKALADLNDPLYPTGPVDGIVDAAGDPVTHASIIAYQNDHGLTPTGTVTPELLARLYPGSASMAGDTNPANDKDCHTVQLIAPFDLSIAKAIPDVMACIPGATCTFYLDTFNHGPNPYSGPLVIRDDLARMIGGSPQPHTLNATGVFPADWSCHASGSAQLCSRTVAMPPMPAALMDLMAVIPTTIPPIGTPGLVLIRNCGTIDWASMGISADINPANDQSCDQWGWMTDAVALDIGIFGGTECSLGAVCRPTVKIRNVGKMPYAGSVGFKGTLHANVAVSRVEGWQGCSTSGASYSCPARRLALKPGEEIVATLPFDLPRSFAGKRILNTFQIDWSGSKEQDKNPINDKGSSVIKIIDAAPQPTPQPTPQPVVPPTCDAGWTQFAVGAKVPRGWETRPLRTGGRTIAVCARQPACISNQVFVNGRCQCPDRAPNWNGKICQACPCNQVWSASSKRCTCPGGTFPAGQCCKSCPDGQRFNARKSACECPSQTPHWTGSQCVSCGRGTEWNARARRCERIAVKPKCVRGQLVQQGNEWICKCADCARRVSIGQNAYSCEPAMQCQNGRVTWQGGNPARPVCTCGGGSKLEGNACSFRCSAPEPLPRCDGGYSQVSAAKAKALAGQGYDIATKSGRGQTIYCARPPRPRPATVRCVDGQLRGQRCVCSGGRQAVAVPGKANTYQCRCVGNTVWNAKTKQCIKR